VGTNTLDGQISFKVNRVNGRSYPEGWERHHIIPQQCRRDERLRRFLESIRPLGFSLNDFATNGLLLPALTRISHEVRLPLHAGGHPTYNARVIAKLHELRQTVRLLAPGRRASAAFLVVRKLQNRLRTSIVGLGTAPLDSIAIRGESDCDIDAALDLIYELRGRRSAAAPSPAILDA